MRREKTLPKESSFKEFSTNRSKKPKTRVRTKKPRFQIKEEKNNKSSGRTNNRDSKSSGRTNSRNNNTRSSGRDGDYKSFSSRGRNTDSRDSRSYSRVPVKHDRRYSRGKSFKENNSDSRKSWNDVPKNMRGIERRNRGVKKIEMFDAVCKKCGKDCKVPFKPQMSKGVSCSDCFDRNAKDNYKKSSGARFSSEYDNFSGRNSQKFARTNGGVKELFDAVCMKCKKPCKVPFKPTGKMGVSCSNCFVKSERPSDRRKSGGRISFGRGKPSNRYRR